MYHACYAFLIEWCDTLASSFYYAVLHLKIKVTLKARACSFEHWKLYIISNLKDVGMFIHKVFYMMPKKKKDMQWWVITLLVAIRICFTNSFLYKYWNFIAWESREMKSIVNLGKLNSSDRMRGQKSRLRHSILKVRATRLFEY